MRAATQAGLRAVYSLMRRRPPSLRRAFEIVPDVIEPVLEEIDTVYSRYLFRAPSEADIERHLRSLHEALPEMAAVRRATRDGSLRRYLDIRPLKLEMDVVNQCNLRCVMCHFSNPDFYRRRKEDLPLEAFTRIGDQIFPLCSQLSLSIGTEPLMHRGLGELLAALPRYRVPWVYMHTNGQLLNAALIARLIDTKFNQLSISIDAATPETYARIRVRGQLARLLANIEALNAAKRARRSAWPRLCFNVVLMRSNIRELPGIIRLAHRYRVSGVAAVHLMPFERTLAASGDESLSNDKALCNRMLEEAGAVAAGLGVQTSFPEPFGARRARPVHRDLGFLQGASAAPAGCCPFPWHFVGIGSTGAVSPCGWWHNKELGNIHEEAFEAMWTRAFAAVRAEHASGNLRPSCRACPSAGTGSVDDASAFGQRRIVPVSASP